MSSASKCCAARRARCTARTPSAARSSTSRAACPIRSTASPRSPSATTTSSTSRPRSAARSAATTAACAAALPSPASTATASARTCVTGQDVSDKEIIAVRCNLGAYVSDDLDVQFALRLDGRPVRRAWRADAGRRTGSRPAFAAAGRPLRHPQRHAQRQRHRRCKGASATVNWRPNENWALKYVARQARVRHRDQHRLRHDCRNKIVDVKAFYSDEQVSHELQVNYDAGGRARGVMGMYALRWRCRRPGAQQLLQPAAFGLTPAMAHRSWSHESIARLRRLDVRPDRQAASSTSARATPTRTSTRACSTAATPMRPSPRPARVGTAANFGPSKTIELQERLAEGLARLPGRRRTSWSTGWPARGFKSGGFNIRANATAVPRSAEPFDDEVVDSFEIGSKMAFLDQTLFLNLPYVPQQVQGHPAVGVHLVRQQWRRHRRRVLRRLHQCRRGHRQGRRGRVPVAADAELADQRQPRLAGRASTTSIIYHTGVNIADQQEFTNAPEFSGARQPGVPHRAGQRRQPVGARRLQLPERGGPTTEITRDP